MFIHFGAFSTLCDGEWMMYNRPYTVEDYHKLQHLFNPQLFDASGKTLAKIAKLIGFASVFMPEWYGIDM